MQLDGLGVSQSGEACPRMGYRDSARSDSTDRRNCAKLGSPSHTHAKPRLTLCLGRSAFRPGVRREYNPRTRRRSQWSASRSVARKRSLVAQTHIVGETQHDFRSAVPSGGHVFRHEALVSGRLGGSTTRRVTSRKAEITDLQFAVGIHEEVSWLEIPMQHVCRVDIL